MSTFQMSTPAEPAVREAAAAHIRSAHDDVPQVCPVEVVLLTLVHADDPRTRSGRTASGSSRLPGASGASMGGSVALMSAATVPGIDAAVDLSGPAEWDGMGVVRRGRALDVPVLVAMATSEGPEETAGAQEIVANAPAGSALLTPEAGHGYVLLNDSEGAVLPLAADALRWIKRHTNG